MGRIGTGSLQGYELEVGIDGPVDTGSDLFAGLDGRTGCRWKLIGTDPVTLICQSVKSISQSGQIKIRHRCCLHAGLLSRSLPAATLPRSRRPDTGKRPSSHAGPILSCPRPTAVRPDWGGGGTHRDHSPAKQVQWRASGKCQARADRTQAGGGGANMALCLGTKLKVGARGVRPAARFGLARGSNTTRSRLVALSSVPLTRIPGLLARGWSNEVLVDSCPRLSLGAWGGTDRTDSWLGAVGCR